MVKKCIWCGAEKDEHEDYCPESKKLRKETVGTPPYAKPHGK